MSIKVLSLCGGIETGMLALDRLGIEVEEYHTFEILPEAITVSSFHYPNIIHHGDLIGYDFTEFKGFDLVISGSCCQSISRARVDDQKVNNGLDGKSGIFFECVRAVREIQPKWFMFENVIPSNDDDLEEMNRQLGVTGKLINSNLFSAQDRERYYWTNFEIPTLPTENHTYFKDIMEHNVDEKYFYKKDFSIINLENKVVGTLNVKTMEMNKRIYNPNFKMCTLTCINGGYHEKKILDNERPRKLTEIEYERLQGLPDNYTNVLVDGKQISANKRRSLCGNGWNLPTVIHVLSGIKTEI